MRKRRRLGSGFWAMLALLGVWYVLAYHASWELDIRLGPHQEPVTQVASVQSGKMEPGGGKIIVLRPSEDGRFYVRGKVNRTNVLFLIDTGAAMNVIYADDAKRIGIQWQNGTAACVETFVGNNCGVWATVPSMEVGGIVRTKVRVFVTSKIGTYNLLGTPFLLSLKRFEFNGVKGNLTLSD